MSHGDIAAAHALECVKKQDTFGKDKIDVQVDGVTLAGPLRMRRNDVVTLSATASFTGSAKVSLSEEDGGLGGEDDPWAPSRSKTRWPGWAA